MPAPAISFTATPLNLPLTPVAKNGWEIRGSAAQPAIGADWTVTLSIVKVNVAQIDDNDETANHSQTAKFPNNEVPTMEALQAKVQTLVDHIFDDIIPKPAGP